MGVGGRVRFVGLSLNGAVQDMLVEEDTEEDCVVVVEVLGPFDTSKFNNSADSSTWTRCNIPFWRAVAACGTHLLLSTLGWISCVKGSHVGLLAFSVGTTLVVATATPLTLLPLLTACGPPMAVPTEDIELPEEVSC